MKLGQMSTEPMRDDRPPRMRWVKLNFPTGFLHNGDEYWKTLR